MMATDYPILGLFWTMLMLFIWMAWLFLVFRIFIDIFRSDDLGGWGKAGWSIFVLLVPLIGVLVYVVTRGDDMRERDIQQIQANDAAMREYVRTTAGSGTGTADELAKLADLRDAGTITDDEFQAQKAKLLA